MPDLPEVSQDFDANTGPAVAGLEELIAVAKQLEVAIERDIVALELLAEVQASTAAAAADSAATIAQAADATGADAARAAEASAANAGLAENLDNVAKASAAEAAAAGAVAGAEKDAALAAAERAVATGAAGVSAAEAAKTEYLLAMAARMTANNTRDAAAATAGAGAAAGVATGFWARWGNVIHWVIAGGSELAAVLIPATVAAGAAALVMAQGVADLQAHLTAMYTTQEATANIFHQTTGQMLGMKDVLQQAQNAADPKVFELLGAGINIAKTDSGQFVQMGVQVLNILDRFAAKVTADMQGAFGGQLHGLLSGGAHDLAGLGAVLGNVGHAVVNLAADMPGLAEVLLALLDGATRLLSVLTGMPGIIITVAMGFEEFARWGGLVSSVLGNMTGVATESTGAWYRLWSNAGIVSQNFARIAVGGFGNVVSSLGRMTSSAGTSALSFGTNLLIAGEAETAVGEEGVAAAEGVSVLGRAMTTTGAAATTAGGELIAAGAGMEAFAAEAEAAAAAITPLEAMIGVGLVVAFGIFIAETMRAKTATQQWIVSVNQALSATSNLEIIPKIASDLANSTVKLTQTQQQLNRAISDTSSTLDGQKIRIYDLGQVGTNTGSDLHALAQEQTHLSQAMQNVLTGAGMLSREYQTTFTGALAIAQGAGVNLTQSLRGTSQAAVDARLQIANYVAGMQAMGETSGAVGHDVTLLGISSELTATKISQLNQAVDQFVSGMTGGTAGLGALAQSILNIGQAIGTTTGTISDSTNGLNLSLTQVQQALTNFGAVGSQIWQNFDQALSGSGEQLADWFRTAGAEGAIGSTQFTKGMQDIVAQFVPFAKDSATAQQELVGFAQAQGLNVSTFPQLVAQLKSAGASSSGLASIVSSTTSNMANMNQIAQALGASLGTDVVGAMNNARLAASGLTGAAQGLAESWNHAHQVNDSVVSGFAQTYKSLYEVYGNTNLAKQAADAYARSLGLTQAQVNILDGDIAALTTQLNAIPRNVSSNVHVQTIYTQSGSAPGAMAHAALPGYQTGAAYVAPGLALVGEHGPEWMRFRGGESVTPAWQASPVARGGGGGGGPVTLHSHLYIDGREVFAAVQDQTYAFNRRNGPNVTGSVAPPG